MRSNKSHYEKEARSQGYSVIAGVDEAGRGPLAGPLVVAACILPEHGFSQEINDSKKLTSTKREELYEELTSNPLVIYSIITLSVEIIDAMNILQATLHGMQKAVEALSLQPNFVLVDGNRSPTFAVPSWPIIEGDSLSYSIGAASILAKVTRDRLMLEYDKQYPMYRFSAHKGYGTREHMDLLKQFGPCPIHRRSYAPVKKASSLLPLQKNSIGR